VVRASGRCLDVVRILRMTAGNRHLEAVALRCQAVLEAMRGRTAAARDILDAGRATFEELGLSLELHETAVHAGIVELLAGDPEEAEALLRGALEGFIGLGVTAGAAQAAAILGRALVEQGKDAEALEQTRLAEAQAGDDLKTTITWLGVRAEVHARAGEHEEALDLARRAVALGRPTDALADKADASMALARVLAAAGRTDEARDVADAARVLYAEKDHVVGVARAAALAAPDGVRSAPVEPERGSQAGPPVAPADGLPSIRVVHEYVRRMNAGDAEGALALCAEDIAAVDHRRLRGDTLHGREDFLGFLRYVTRSVDMRLAVEEVLAADDRAVAFLVSHRWSSSDTGGRAELVVAWVWTLDGGLIATMDGYDPDDREAALARFGELRDGRAAALGDGPVERAFAAAVAALNDRDLERYVALHAPGVRLTDHRAIGWGETVGHDALREFIASGWAVSADMQDRVEQVLATDGRRVVALRSVWRGSGGGVAGEFELCLPMVAVAEAGVMVGYDLYDDDVATLARYAELTDQPPWLTFDQLVGAGAFDALAAICTDDFVMVDRRAIAWEDTHGADGLIAITRGIAGMSDGVRARSEALLHEGDVALVRNTFSGRGTEAVGDFEAVIDHVVLLRAGRIASVEMFDPADEASSRARFEELRTAPRAQSAE
jgi:tetratricopeptide (TPR) repeat protein